MGTKMNCLDFLNKNEDYFESVMQDCYWDGGFNSNRLLAATAKLMLQNHVIITDLEQFDVESYFYKWYVCIEKGLS